MNEAIYTTLSWPQIALGLLLGFIGIYFSIGIERFRRELSGRNLQGDQPEPEPTAPREGIPRLVSGIVRAAYCILSLLASQRKESAPGALARRVYMLRMNRRENQILTPLAIQIATERLIAQQHIRLRKGRLQITDSGKELLDRLARLNDHTAPEKLECSVS